MWQLILRGVVAGVVVMAVTELAQKSPKVGAFVLTLPVVSIIAFISVWHARHEVGSVASLARETLVLVPLGLPFFVPLALADKWGMGFWTAFFIGVGVASVGVGGWLWWGPKTI